jgi:type II secretory pathway pseudopilin PulG
MMALSRSRQSGISVFETTVVLSVVGFLMWVVLNIAQGIIDRAMAKTLANEMRDVKNMVLTYRDRYHAIPGDAFRPKELPAGAVPSPNWSSGDGAIGSGGILYDGWFNSGPVYIGRESTLFWNHVRLAGLAGGDPLKGVAYNAVRGQIGISSDKRSMPKRPNGMGGVYGVCSSNITGGVARMMDADLDDGDATTGRVWAGRESNLNPVLSEKIPQPYLRRYTYTVCMAF